MSINYIYKYPLDLTGQNPDNFISGDLYTLQPGVNRVIVPRDGAFYTNGLVLRDTVTGQVLTPNTQYVAVMYYREPSERSGLEVMTAIVVTDGSVSNQVSVDMQLVGGIYSNIGPTIMTLIGELNLDNREVRWGDILGKPHAFNPSHHLHDIGDVYGFEYVVEALDRIANAVLYGDQAALDELRQYVDMRDDYVLDQIQIAVDEISNHISDTNNPHNTTKSQVGLGSVQNYAMATAADMVAAVLQANKYVSPANFTHYFASGAGKPLVDHIGRTDNPHNTNKTHVGLGLVENYAPAVNNDMLLVNLPSNKYVTPSLLHRYMTHGAGKFITDHVANTNNPHGTTKAHVGLSNVPNVDMTNIANATSGILPLARGGTNRTDGKSPALVTPRTIAMTGDVTWTSAAFDGSGNVTGTATLANSGVAAGTYTKVAVDAKGRVTVGATLAVADIPNLDTSKLTAGILPIARGGTGRSDGRAPQLITARTISATGDAAWSVSFDGSGNATAALQILRHARPIAVSSNVTATRNASHHITGNNTVTLPNVTALTVNDVFIFSKENGVTPTIRVQNTTSHRISYLGARDTAVAFDDDCAFVIIYRGGNNFTLVRY